MDLGKEPLIIMAFIIVPATLLTQLQAVNLLISTLGEAEVDSLSGNEDATEALSRLNEADLECQSIGWNWNRLYGFQLTLNDDGTITLPDETLGLTAAYAQGNSPGPFQGLVSSGNLGQRINVVQRGTLLFDPVNNTTVFPYAPIVDLIVRIDWDSLPQVARQYITYKAAQRFHARKQGEGIVLQVNTEDIKDAFQTLNQREDENVPGQLNSIDGNANVLQAIYGVGGMRRNRAGL